MKTLWDEMPEDWKRWASLQVRRYPPLSDPEWIEFCELDLKFGVNI